MGGNSQSMSWSPDTWGTNDPETGNANSPIGRFFQGAFGKHGSTTAQLPAELKWINQFAQGLAQSGAQNVNYDASNAATQAGVAGSNALTSASTGVGPGTAAAWNTGVTNLQEGANTGFMPGLSYIDSLLRPGLERGFQTGAADIREQNALTGNLSSSGTSQQMTDYRAQLENALSANTANVASSALPASMNIRSGMTNTAIGLPGYQAQSLWSPSMQGGLSGQDAALKAIQAAFSSIGASPYSANQGSGGNSGAGSMLSMVGK